MGRVSTRRRWSAIPSSPLAEQLGLSHVQTYRTDVEDGTLTVITSVDGGLWHLSISHGVWDIDSGDLVPGRIPTWDELRDARYDLVPDHLVMAMLLPPLGQYVNVHDTTMHLWEVPT